MKKTKLNSNALHMVSGGGNCWCTDKPVNFEDLLNLSIVESMITNIIPLDKNNLYVAGYQTSLNKDSCINFCCNEQGSKWWTWGQMDPSACNTESKVQVQGLGLNIRGRSRM